MADRSLYNEDLTLSKLTVDNSTSSQASGYVATSTTIVPNKVTSPQVATDLLGLFSTTTTHPPVISTANDNLIVSLYGDADIQITGTTGGLSAPAITAGNTVTIQNGTGSPNDVVLSCPQNDVLNVGGSVIATSVELLSSTGSVNLTAPTNGTLTVGGNVQCAAVGTTQVTFQNGSSNLTVNNTNGVISTISPIATSSSVSATTFIGGMVCANWVPASPIACSPGLYTSTTCVIQNVPTNINYANCVYSFQAQAINAQTGCVPVVFPSYTATLNGNDLTLTIYISVAAGTASAAINYIGIMIINPGYSATAP
jgi:hypothetical protein